MKKEQRKVEFRSELGTKKREGGGSSSWHQLCDFRAVHRKRGGEMKRRRLREEVSWGGRRREAYKEGGEGGFSGPTI